MNSFQFWNEPCCLHFRHQYRNSAKYIIVERYFQHESKGTKMKHDALPPPDELRSQWRRISYLPAKGKIIIIF